MAPREELFKEREPGPDGHANSMGNCFSASRKKAPNSSSFSSRGDPKHAYDSMRAGKACHNQISCLNNSEQASGRSTSAVKDCHTSLLAASATSANHEHTHCNTANASYPVIHAHHMPQNNGLMHDKKHDLSDDKKHDAPTDHHTHTNKSVSFDRGSAASGFVDASDTANPTHTDKLHTSASIPKTPLVHKFSSLSLKSGVGPYEVLTPRKPREGSQGMTQRKSGSTTRPIPSNRTEGNNTRKIGRATQICSKGLPLQTKDQGVKELCKNCKTSNLDSVCFIANDGRIAASNTGPPTICHFHHCNSPKCAANPNYHPPSSVPCKNVLLSKTRSLPCQPARTKRSNNVSHNARAASMSCTTSLTSPSDNGKDMPNGTQLCREGGHVDAPANVCGEILVLNQGGKESDEPPSVLMVQCVDTQENCSENGHNNAVAPLKGSHDANGGDIEKRSLTRNEDVQRMDLKAMLYHGDNEVSWSDDGTDTPTLKRSFEGAFDDLSNTDIAQPDATKASQARKSSMERMRQRYLNSLKEQEAETVRLKKREMQARKQAGEWMLDCVMGEILHRLAPDGEAGVKVLVEAFETIMQHSDLEAHHVENAAHECIGLEDASKPLNV